MKKLLLLCSFVFAFVVGIWLFQPTDRTLAETTPPPTAQPERTKATLPRPAAPERTVQAPARVAGLPPSYRGTTLDGALPVDTNGQLIVCLEVRQLFDYFLSALGEESLQASVDRLRRYIAGQLEAPARAQALALLDDYLTYKRALLDVDRAQPRVADLAALRQRHEQVRALRASIFSVAAHEAFFGFEEARDGYALQRLAIVHDTTLSAQAKGEAIDRLRAGLPDDVQSSLVPQLQQELRSRTARLRAEGATPQAVRAMRQQLVGAQATARLEALDAQRQGWEGRVSRFLADMARIEHSSGLAASERQVAIERMMVERFSPQERLRLAGSVQLAQQDDEG
ncbi:lipase secretion chaperone [Stutzerimonas urumqiensis]|uniref:lipase secretion chaperone n=1 Tax=Stutzerimonas urumqiensis TaxID=638269 RepID=UPI003BABB5DB